MNFELWLMFFLAYLIVTLSPGPNVLLVLKNGLQHGWKSAFITIFANLTCQFIIVSLVAVGIGEIIQKLPFLFFIMKVLGGAYLIYLGIKSLRTKKKSTFDTSEIKNINKKTNSNLFVEAFLVSASNPKTLIFLSAFLPQFLDIQHPIYMQFFIMFVTICFIVMSIHLLYSFSIVYFGKRFSLKDFERKIAKVTGGLFITMGGSIILSNRS